MSETFISNTVKVNFVELTNYKGRVLDITNLVYEINIYENIYVNTIAGTIDVLDSNDLPQFFPLIGEETIELELQLPGSDDSSVLNLKNYRIYKISDREIRSNKIQSYKLWFISKEAITNTEQSICKLWNQKSAKSIVSDAFTILGSDKKIEIENTQGIFNYISTNLNPLQVINYIGSHKSINVNKLSDYVFFQKLDKKEGSKFVFKSMSSLASETPVIEFSYNPVTLKSQKTSVKPYNIENIDFKKGFNVLENKVKGLYNQTFVYYDLLRKRYVVQKNSYEDIFKETENVKIDGKGNSIIGKNPNTFSEYTKFIWASEFPQKISTNKNLDNVYNKGIENNQKRSKSSYINNHLDISETASNLLEQTLYRRSVLLNEFENNKIYLNDVSGNYNYNAGTVVSFQKPHIVNNFQDAVDKSSDNYDVFISGNYLISKNRHRIIRGNGLNWVYKNFLEVTKNSLKSPLSKI